MWLTPKEVEVIGLMISLVSDAYHIAPHNAVRYEVKKGDVAIRKFSKRSPSAFRSGHCWDQAVWGPLQPQQIGVALVHSAVRLSSEAQVPHFRLRLQFAAPCPYS